MRESAGKRVRAIREWFSDWMKKWRDFFKANRVLLGNDKPLGLRHSRENCSFEKKKNGGTTKLQQILPLRIHCACNEKKRSRR